MSKLYDMSCDLSDDQAFRLLGLWYDLGDGLGFSSESKLATFQSKASAITFKQAAPSWTIGYRLAESAPATPACPDIDDDEAVDQLLAQVKQWGKPAYTWAAAELDRLCTESGKYISGLALVRYRLMSASR